MEPHEHEATTHYHWSYLLVAYIRGCKDWRCGWWKYKLGGEGHPPVRRNT